MKWLKCGSSWYRSDCPLLSVRVGGNPPFQDWKSLVILIPVHLARGGTDPIYNPNPYGSQLS